MPSRVTIERMGNPRLAQIAADDKSMQGLCMSLVALGKQLCPVDQGPLRNTVMAEGNTPAGHFEMGFNESPKEKATEDQKLDMPVGKNMAVFGSGSDHWYPEFGTRFQQAQPFLRPAMELLVGKGEAARIVAKYNAEEMARQFKAGIRQFSYYKSGEAVPPESRA